MKIEELVNIFAENVHMQNDFIEHGNAIEGNKCAKKYINAFKALIKDYGNNGRESLATLLNHENEGIRQMAAAFLLKYKTDEAQKVLKKIATGKGLIAFAASETLKRWDEGTWALDE